MKGVRGYILTVVESETERPTPIDPIFVLARCPADALRVSCHRLVRYGDSYAKVEVRTLASGQPLQGSWNEKKRTYNLFMKREFRRAEPVKPEKKV